MGLSTMPDLRWTVYVQHWNWVYTFSRTGGVTWRDPFNGQNGKGSWRIENGTMITRWVNSKTWEEWDVPINPAGANGTCHMTGGTHALWAEAQNYYVGPGDVVKADGKKYVIYPDEVRSGGTVAWVCRNPGAIRDGDKYGAYKGKKYQTNQAGAFAIFPTVTLGLKAVVSVLKGYGAVSIIQAMNKYAPKKDGNDPDKYAKILADGLKVGVDTMLGSVDLNRMAELITGVETEKEGERYMLYDDRLPKEVRIRLTKPGPYPPTDEEIRNSSMLMPW
jgi:hypothetical protein